MIQYLKQCRNHFSWGGRILEVNSRLRFLTALIAFVLVQPCLAQDAPQENTTRPNIILIMTDDQGWGDFGFHGNQVIKTPQLDQLAEDSVRFTEFYVSPVCSPTRACLMTGRYNYRTRCIDTYIGRSMMDTDEVTIAESLKAVGYTTGIFGKWHLGDCCPMRPIDQGFDVSVTHLGGGLCQPSDPLENRQRYTDPILFRNGEPFQSKGFCTDVYFDHALQFISDANQSKQPFFAYIATNAPHGPFHDVPVELKQQYLEDPDGLLTLPISEPGDPAKMVDRLASIAAMITNVDQNVHRLLASLKAQNLSDNTLVIFMTDNGPNTMRYVGDRRGMKTTVNEGGVRSPLWLYWPNRLQPSDVDLLSAHIDVFPTIAAVAGASLPSDRKIDGRSLWEAAEGRPVNWEDRSIVLQTHRGDQPQRFHHFTLRKGPWKLVHPSGFGRESIGEQLNLELYNLIDDPKESVNVIEQNFETAEKLKQEYSEWFDDVSSSRANNYDPPRIYLGTEFEKVTVLNRNEWRAANWNDDTVGVWKVDVRQSGNYHIKVQFRRANPVDQINLSIGETKFRSTVTSEQTNEFVFQVKLEAGEADLRAWYDWKAKDAKASKGFGAYQVFVQRADKERADKE